MFEFEEALIKLDDELCDVSLGLVFVVFEAGPGVAESLCWAAGVGTFDASGAKTDADESFDREPKAMKGGSKPIKHQNNYLISKEDLNFI